MRILKPRSAAWVLVGMAAAGMISAPASAADSQIVATSCSGCHTNSEKLTTSIPRIRGLPEAVILEAMRAFRAGQRPATVMDRIARGFTDDEIKQLAAHFSARQ